MKIVKKYKYHIISFIIPLIICIIFLFSKGVFNNIDSIFVSDLSGQHLSFYNYLKNILLGKASIHYSYYAGMGSKMIPTLIFYMISPLNILLVLIKDIRYAILFIYIFKICLSSLTMYLLLNYKFNKKTCMTIAFSSCYSLSSFVINYYFCIFWFDSIYLAPLVLLGIEKIYNDKKINLVYIFSLSLAIICNIQMGFSLCIFSLIYYIYIFSIKYEFKKDFKIFLSLSKIFIISSLCAGAISSGFILPIIKEYKSITLAREIGIISLAGTSSPDYIIKSIFSIGKIKNDYFNVYDPYIYCGLIITFLSILYFFNENISKREKKSSMFVILIFIISFFIKPLNDFWHLSEPILLNYRYSIFLSLFLILLSYETYLTKDKFLKKDYIVLSVSLAIGLLIDIIYNKELYIWITILFMFLVLFSLIITKNKTLKFEKILFFVIIIELLFNAKLSFYTNNDLPFDKYSSLESLKELNSFNTFNQGYRVLTDYSYTEYYSDMFILGHNSSLRYFSSIINGNIINFFYRTSLLREKSNYSVSAYESPLLLSLLGNKYFYLLQDNSLDLYKKIDEYNIRSYDFKAKKNKNKKVYLYKNPYALSLGYIIEKDAKYKSDYDLIDYQNSIIKSFTGNNIDIINRLELEVIDDDEACASYKNCKKYYVENNTNNKYVYFYAPTYTFSTQEDVKTYGSYGKPFVIMDEEGENEVYLLLKNKKDTKYVRTATYDKDKLIDSLKMLQENMLTKVKIDKNIMQGNIDSSKEGILFLSIPYDNKFKIYVDGKKVKYYPLLDNTFIGLDLNKGKHKIKIEYIDNDLKWYILSSLLSIIVTLTIYRYNYKKTK